MADVTPKPERLTLTRDYSELLVELSIALHKYAIYPNEHPSLLPAATAVADRAQRLLEDRPLLAVGVARHQLIIEGVATDPTQPVLRRLADGLHRHHLGAISFRQGLDPVEVGAALRELSADATSTRRPIRSTCRCWRWSWPSSSGVARPTSAASAGRGSCTTSERSACRWKC